MNKNINNKKAVVIFGAPGSGKGTQANLVAGKLDIFHLDTGKFLEQLVNDPANKNNKEIQKEKKLFNTGILLTPAFVLKFIAKKVNKIASLGSGVVLSGSPRTYFEAFGDKNNVGLVETLEKLYGKNNVKYMLLDASSDQSMQRNSNRLLCSSCGTQLLSVFKVKYERCPFCGGVLRTRTLDKPEVIKIRLVEYAQRTEPIIKELKKRGCKINKIKADKLPYEVFNMLIKKI